MKTIIRIYTDIEMQTRIMTDNILSSTCKSCTTKCCKKEICDETLNSPFLSLVIKSYPPLRAFNKKTGWLSKSGCVLKVGRPPVCHEYYCEIAKDIFIKNNHAQLFKILSVLINYLGSRTYRNRHIVTLREEELLKIRYEDFIFKSLICRSILKVLKGSLVCEERW